MHNIEQEDIEKIIETLEINHILGRTFLITGSTGSLGRYCVMVLMELAMQNPDKPCKVIVLCRNLEKCIKIWRKYLNNPNFTIIEGSVEEKIQFDKPIDYIMHAACISATQYFYTNPVQIASANVIGTYNLLNLAKEKNVKSFLFFSSGAVYGGNTEDDESYIGLEPLDYRNCYNMSKRMGENFCASFAQQYGIPAKVIRIGGYTYGPHIDLDDGHLYSDFIKAIIQHENLVIKGDGQNYIGMMYITDAVIAFFKVLFDGKENVVYVMRNADEIITIEELAIMLTQEVFPERGLNYKCLREISGEKPRLVIKIPNNLKELGWDIQVRVAEGFRRTVKCLEEIGEGR